MVKRTQSLLCGLMVLIITSLLLAGCSSLAGTPAPVPGSAAPVAAPRPEASPGPSGAPDEGIKVHGRWTIEVRNPDGSLAERREFDNALSDFGAETLAILLARRASVGGWQIRLNASARENNAFLDGTTPSGALLTESSYTGLGSTRPTVFKTVTLTASTGPARVQLSGTATAQRDGNIGIVDTWVGRLPATDPPSSSYEGANYGFTSTTLTSPVRLTSGQQVVVTVVISFS